MRSDCVLIDRVKKAAYPEIVPTTEHPKAGGFSMSTVPHNSVTDQASGSLYLLDLFSIRQSNPLKCIYNAPHICIPPKDGRPGYLSQTCCNHWDCPRCGQLRAKHEYGRMVVGARKLAEAGKLYMMTVTLPGDISLLDGEADYYEKTNRLHASINYYAKKHEIPWAYAAVTERQKRGHPHSHYISMFCPLDAFYIVDDYERYCDAVHRVNAQIPKQMRHSPELLKDIDHRQMYSEWLSLACVKAGLGVQCRLAIADLVEGASRYIAKYLFKTAMFEVWPPKWRRVRYSNNWPGMPEFATTDAFPVISRADWTRVALLPGAIEISSPAVYELAMRHLCLNVVCNSANAYDLEER